MHIHPPSKKCSIRSRLIPLGGHLILLFLIPPSLAKPPKENRKFHHGTNSNSKAVLGNPPNDNANTLNTVYLEQLIQKQHSSRAFMFIADERKMKPWLEHKLSSGVISSQPHSRSLVFLYRRKRQLPSGGGGPAVGTAQDGMNSLIYTPVLPITGKKLYNDTDCLPWDKIAVIFRSGIDPYHKQRMVEDSICNFDSGLECIPVPKQQVKGQQIKRNNVNFDWTCRCMLSYGPQPVVKKNGTNGTYHCYIPAGIGWPSECHNKNWMNYGYPLPYGDPTGANAEPAVQVDGYNRKEGNPIKVAYIFWNSITPPCVPHSECIARGTYVGERCQCDRKAKLKRPEGICGGAIRDKPGIFLIPSCIFILIQILTLWLPVDNNKKKS